MDMGIVTIIQTETVQIPRILRNVYYDRQRGEEDIRQCVRYVEMRNVVTIISNLTASIMA